MNNADLTRRDLWLTRFYYLLFFGGSGFMSPFLNILYVHLGLTGTQVGIVTASAAAVTLVAAPFWASKNEGWRNPRGMLQLFLVFSALGYLWLTQQALFAGVAVVSIFRALVTAGISPLSDSLALSVTKAARAGYGGVRVWGSIGWIVFVPMSGWLIERTSLEMGLVGAGLITLLGALILTPIDAKNFTTIRPQGQTKPKFRDAVNRLLHNRAMLGMALMIILIGLANSGVTQFEGVYLQQLGAKEGLIGILGIMSALVELPCMLWADRLAAKRGAYPLLLLSMLLTGTMRVLVFSFASIPAIAIARGAGGIGFSFYTVGVVRFTAEQTESHETRTVLALYTVTLTALISIIGSPITGTVFDALGPRWLYLIAAVGYFLSWGVLQVMRPQPEAVAVVVPQEVGR